MINKYRKKPIVIEAIQLTVDSFHECIAFIGEGVMGSWTATDACYIEIQTLEGTIRAREGDWIIKGVKGEFYPCKPDIFNVTYDVIDWPDCSKEEGDETTE
jgi:hypothetical protein